MGMVTAGTLLTSFGQVILEYLNSKGLDVIMPDIEAGYATWAASGGVDLVNTINSFLESYGLGQLSAVVTFSAGMIDYVITEVVFAYLTGELTEDPNYA